MTIDLPVYILLYKRPMVGKNVSAPADIVTGSYRVFGTREEANTHATTVTLETGKSVFVEQAVLTLKTYDES